MVKVLVVDDSPTMRAILKMALDSAAGIAVIGEAADAIEARALIKALNPDVVTLDIEMPGMNGIDFLEKIMALRPMPVVIVSGISKAGAAATLRALELGAFDCIAKPGGALVAAIDGFTAQLVETVKAAARAPRRAASPRPAAPLPLRQPHVADRQLIAIGASTGGIEALHRLLPSFPADCPPTLVVQHINQAFAGSMAEMLDARCAARVKLAESGETLQTGTIYIAPGSERHLVLSSGDRLAARLAPGDPVSGHRPSVDAMFRSVAGRLGPHVAAALLTGMGCDGAAGLAEIHRAGGLTVAQSEASCTVYGMSRAAVELGAASRTLPIERIAAALLG